MSFSDRILGGAVGALNVGGKVLNRAGIDVPSLSRDSLFAAARKRTGLGDIGPWEIDEPLNRLLEAYESESNLTALGRITVRELIVSLLENLLYMEQERKSVPAIENEPISAPTFIIGLPRTGTTLLHGLMSEDPINRVPLTWEVMYPSRFPNTPEGIARARQLTASRLGWANRLAPQFKKIHPIAPDLPQECIAITAQVFMSIQFHTTHDVTSYENWFEQDSQQLAYEFHRRLLQHLQNRNPGRRWVLKAPGHLFALDALLAASPDAKIVQTHRDPLRVMASMASHATVLRRAFSDRADPEQIAADWSQRWSAALNDFLAHRDQAPPAQFFDVAYDDIESRPFETVAQIYDFLGWPLTADAERAMRAFLAANPKNKHGVHRYSLAEYGLSRTDELNRFADYCKRFDIAVQADL
ncbi:MAG: sulfotransferase [Gammaproteobacteria bacterium]|nr:sulfotransferase [Gammaproteobacteria bacterium]